MGFSRIVYAVTLGPTRRAVTPITPISLHLVTPDFFFGFERAPNADADIATPEKALLDFFYLRPARSRRFRALPELELPRRFSEKRARAMVVRIRSKSRRALVAELLDHALSGRKQRGARIA
jgi:hypothetical protein